jgi:chitinase
MLRSVVTNKISWALAGLLVVAVLVPLGLGRSEAAFVGSSSNPNSIFNSASSFNTVVVSITDPGTPLRSTVMLNAVATSDRPISSVVFQTSPAGAGTWTTACTDNVAPYSCAWDTTAVADGLRDIRAVASDTGGYSQTAGVTNRRVDNTGATATTTDPGSPLTGTVAVTGVGSDLGGSGVASTTVQYRPSGGGSWTNICTQSGSTATCSWNTAALADGLYDVRTVAADVAGNAGTPSPVITNRRLDNIAPSATMTAPAANLTGSITLASTSSDAANGSGVASVRYEYKLSAGSTWTTACTGATTPFSCSFNTASVADGLYDFRAIATDGVGKTGTSAAVTSRRIDNTAPTATMGALAANLSGSVSLTSTPADSGSGLAGVQYQYKLTTDSTWTDTCSSSTSPWSCTLNTASLTDGLYDFRVVATDNVGITGPSAAVTSRRVDNTNPTVTMGALAAWLDGTVTLTSTPADGGGIASVQYQYKLSSSGTWLNACSSATTPYSCSFSTTALTNGSSYDFRAIATDNATRTGTSGTVTSRIDHTNPTVTMTSPAAYLAGSVTLASTAADTGGSGVGTVLYEYKLSSGSTWTAACASSTTPFTCAFNTASVADGLYDFRATVTDNVGRATTSATVTGRRIDNTNPITATLAAVGTNLAGNVNFTGTSADNAGGSGVGSWKVQTSPTGTNTWTDLCTDTTTPFTACTGNVDGLADGVYDFRSVTTDLAGNTLASAVQTNKRVDTDGPVTSIASPANGARVRGNVTMTANASDPAGVQSVDFQVFLFGGWFTFCSDNTPTYTCTGDSTQVADGTYQTRVVATDTLGHQTASAIITLVIDNTGPTANDVQSANGGTAGKIDAGDTMTFTWSEPMAPASILTGWSGASTPVRVFVDNNVGGNNDAIFIYNSTGATRLNVTNATGLLLNANYVAGDVWLDGTMVMSGNSAVVTVGAIVSGTSTGGVAGNATMRWNSSNAATDVAGNAASGNAVNEGGGGDRDF